MFMKFRSLACLGQSVSTALAICVGLVATQSNAAEASKQDPIIATSTNRSEGDIAAEQAWKALVKALHPPPAPESWRTNAPSPEEIAAFNKRNGELAGQVADQAREFYTWFPNHPRAEEARKKELEMRRTAVQLGNVKQVAQLNETEDRRGGEAPMETDERLLLRWRTVQRQALQSGPEDSRAYIDKLQEGILTLAKEFPNRPEVFSLMMQLLRIQSQIADGDKARALIRAILESKAPEELKWMATMVRKRFELQGKPVRIKFTASDGREVDLESMRGKVVLLDFWASWCPVCLAEIPRVKSAYGKLHPKGFEIIGINSDDERKQMQRVLDVSNITWPQFFDGQGQTNRFGLEFGIIALPTMWLVDKQGVLRDLNARMNLEEKVEKLLSEQPPSQ